MGRLGEVHVVPMGDVAPVDLPGGGWSRVILTGSRVASGSCLGFSSFAAGTETAMLSHETEELAYVVTGEGRLRTDGGVVSFGPADALFIPARVWHAVVNSGREALTMVFTFPHPDYPPTERRPAGPDGASA